METCPTTEAALQTGLLPAQERRKGCFAKALGRLKKVLVGRILVSDIRRSPDACSANKCRIRESDLRAGVDWVDKPNFSDGLWICWVFNPTYPPRSDGLFKYSKTDKATFRMALSAHVKLAATAENHRHHGQNQKADK